MRFSTSLPVVLPVLFLGFGACDGGGGGDDGGDGIGTPLTGLWEVDRQAESEADVSGCGVYTDLEFPVPFYTIEEAPDGGYDLYVCRSGDDCDSFPTYTVFEDGERNFSAFTTGGSFFPDDGACVFLRTVYELEQTGQTFTLTETRYDSGTQAFAATDLADCEAQSAAADAALVTNCRRQDLTEATRIGD